MKINSKLIAFFKKHNLYDEKAFSYIEEHSTMLDSNFPDEMMLRTCAYQIDSRTNVLKGIHVNVPYVKDEKTMLDNIHELTHAIFAYKKIGKKFKKDITIETLPLLYERLYLLENPSEELKVYTKYLDSLVTQDDKAYMFALQVREELLNSYDANPQKIVRRLKKISRKYHC